MDWGEYFDYQAPIITKGDIADSHLGFLLFLMNLKNRQIVYPSKTILAPRLQLAIKGGVVENTLKINKLLKEPK